MQSLIPKSAKKDLSRSQVVSLTSALIGKSIDDLTFHTFKQWACKGKILFAHSKFIQKSLLLSDTASNTFDAILLLHFIHLFKAIIWKSRCDKQIKWEVEHQISHKQKCSQDQDKINEEAMTHLDVIIEGQRPGNNDQDENEFSGNLIDSQTQVLDDIVSPIRPLPIHSDSHQDKTLRRWEAAHLAWKDMTNYIKHNYTAEWMPRMFKYFNKFTKMSDEL